MATIALEQVSKTYPNGFEAVHASDLTVKDGEFMVLVGPSGCGKTTILRMVAGLEEITGGTLRFGDKVVNYLSPKERDVAMVFQNYALYPHMSVFENIAFALKLRKTPREEIQRKVRETAEILGLTEWLDRKPKQLSGGQRQRVAMGRAIVREPSVFLMDEPLSNLDAKLRVQMRAEITRIQRRVGVATLYVTHDQTEAMTMGDRVAVLKAGSIQQCDLPQVLYDEPANLFVAGFMGSPAMNLYRGSCTSDLSAVRLGSQHLPLSEEVRRRHPGLDAYRDREVVVGLRPEHLRAVEGEDHRPRLNVDVTLVEALGNESIVHFTLDTQRVLTEGTVDDTEDATPTMASEGTARVPAGVAVAAGKAVPLAVDIDSAHFFDPSTEKAI